LLDQLIQACDLIARRAATFSFHVSASEEISTALAGVVERPLPEAVESRTLLASAS
jgi:hypothetical protein